MTALVPIIMPPGVVRGASPSDSPGRWYDTNLVRWRGGVLEPIGGWQRITSTPFSSRVRRIHRYRDNSKIFHTLLFLNDAIYASNNAGGWTDVTIAGLSALGSGGLPVGFGVGPHGEEFYGAARTVGSEVLSAIVPMWSADNWGEDVLAVSSADGRVLLYDTSVPETAVTVLGGTTPTSNRAVLVTEERHAMCIQSGGNPRRVAWSTREDYTDWDFASTTNTAGFLELECKTPLFTMTKVRGGVLVWSETEVFAGRFIGSPFVYGFEVMDETRIIGPRALATDDGSAFWWSIDGFHVSDGSQLTRIPCPVWSYLMNNINRTVMASQVFASAHGSLPEIWFFYPSTDATVADSYVVYNYAEQWWAIGSLDREAMAPAVGSQAPVMAGTNHHIYNHEIGYMADGVSRADTVYAESGAVVIPPAGDRNLEITQAMISSDNDTDALELLFYTKQTPQGAERTFGPYSTRANGYIDTRVSGRDVRIRLNGVADTHWTAGQIRLDVVSGAKR